MKLQYLALFVAALLAANCSSDTALIRAIKDKRLDEARALVQKQEDVNKMGECSSALMEASKAGDEALVQALLEQGADPNLKSPDCVRNYTSAGIRFKDKIAHETALMYASTPEIARMLIGAGANKEAVDMAGQNAIHWALQRRKPDLALTLIQSGVPVNIYDMCGKNQLLYMIREYKGFEAADQKKVEAALLRAGAREFPYSDAKGKATEGKVMTAYTHDASGQKTSMEPAFAQMLYQDPDKFTEDAYSAHHDRFFHASEFTWVENGQNLWEWMIIRNRFVDKSRDRQKCK